MSATTPQQVTPDMTRAAANLVPQWRVLDCTKNRYMRVHSTNGRTSECGHICDRTSCNMGLTSPITSYLHISFNSRYVPMSPGYRPRCSDMYAMSHARRVCPAGQISNLTGHTVYLVSLLHWLDKSMAHEPLCSRHAMGLKAFKRVIRVPNSRSGLVWSGLHWSYIVWSGLHWSGYVRSGLAWSGVAWPGLHWYG